MITDSLAADNCVSCQGRKWRYQINDDNESSNDNDNDDDNVFMLNWNTSFMKIYFIPEHNRSLQMNSNKICSFLV